VSSALAIAAVTAVLRDLLQNGLIDAAPATGSDVKVTALPPNRMTTDRTEVSGINLFMYHTTPNSGWRNVDYPSFNSNGDRVSSPMLALDLHYLLTAYGAEDLHTDVLLGYAMQLLHETPVITRDAIHRAFPAAGVPVDTIDPQDPIADLPAALRRIAESDLADQVELVKLTPEAISTEEMSRLWAAFQSPYRPTAVYRASVVLIERKRAFLPTLPVLEPQVTVLPISQPVISSVLPVNRPDRIILPVSTVALRGRALRGEQLRINIDGADVDPGDIASITDSRIELLLPAALRAGVHGVQVIHPWLVGVPRTPHGGVRSDVASFVLHPQIQKDGGGNYRITYQDVPPAGGNPRLARFLVTADPAIAPNQEVFIELLQPSVDFPTEAAIAHLGVAPARTADANQITFELSGVPEDDYLVRIRVDGAESPLDRDPNTFVATGPKVTVDIP
jgi:hypothetical protein